MPAPAGDGAQTIEFAASDGTRLIGELFVPERPIGAAIVCHPHTLYGGDRHNAVVVAIAEALTKRQIASLRFDFRRPFDEGRGERADALAAADVVSEAAGNVPLVICGYSFGAMIGASVAEHAERAVAQVLVAPPVTSSAALPAPKVETLILVPVHDQFAPPAAIAAVVDEWQGASEASIELDVIESTDHSIVGRGTWTADRAARWLSDRLPPPSPL